MPLLTFSQNSGALHELWVATRSFEGKKLNGCNIFQPNAYFLIKGLRHIWLAYMEAS